MKTEPISYSRQTIDKDDIKSVTGVLKSSYLTQGPTIKNFEDELKKVTESKFVVAVSSGTAALHAACFSINIEKDDEVIVPPLTFVASSNCVLYLGGRPIFADVDQRGLLNPREIKKHITKKTKAIITIDYAGQPSYLKEIKEICRKYNLYLIEDASHSLGAFYYNKPIGSFADLTCFSFHPVKTITTGEGGAITTNNKNLFEKMISFRTHGIKKTDNHPWYYEMHSLGFNYRLSDIHAALGYSQLKKMKQFLRARKKIREIYDSELQNFENKGLISLPKILPNTDSSWHLYPLLINFKKINKTKREVFEFFAKKGIKLQVHYIPVHFQPYYQKKLGYKKGDYPVAEKFYEQEVSLPLYPTLTTKQVNLVVSTLGKCLNA